MMQFSSKIQITKAELTIHHSARHSGISKVLAHAIEMPWSM
jgi:hypothetical protein